MHLTMHQRTTTFVQLMIRYVFFDRLLSLSFPIFFFRCILIPSTPSSSCRCVGVIGGIFVCMGYAIRITSRAVDVVSGTDQTQGTIAAEATGVRPGGLRSKFSGSQIHSRKTSLGRVVRQGNGWVVENPIGPLGTPASATFTPSSRPSSIYSGSYSPYAASPGLAPPSANGPGPIPGSPGVGLGISLPSFGPAHPTLPTAPATVGSPYAPSSPGMQPPPPPRTPSSGYAHLPPTPNPVTGNGLSFAPLPQVDRKSSGGGKKDE
jgi:hypothetical protein